MNRIVELEQKSSELLSDIEDVIHAASINMRAACVETSQEPIATLQQQFLYTEGLLQSLKELISSRQSLFMTFMITKQIQQEEAKVRRQRLNEYEQKIYDQKRIIVQKELFFESLLRPKRKRQPHQTIEEYQQSRARQRQKEQKFKADKLVREMMDFQGFRRMIDEQERLKRKAELQSTKGSSLSNLTTSNLDVAQLATERPIPSQQKAGKDSRSIHNRTNSAQHCINKEVFSPRKDDQSSDLQNAKIFLEEISKMNENNDQLHKIYDQQINSYNFKLNQKSKLQKQYEILSLQLKNTKAYFGKLVKQQSWRHEKVYQLPVPHKKRSDSK